jgi:hypothetical protein
MIWQVLIAGAIGRIVPSRKRELSRTRLPAFQGALPEVGKPSCLRKRKGEDSMKLTLSALVGGLTFIFFVIVISTPLQQIPQWLAPLAH